MPKPAPHPSGPERKPAQSPADAPPPGRDAAPTRPAPKGALVHTMLEGGFDPVVA